jgi:hypothetical protein
MLHLCKHAMNQLTIDRVWEAFDRADCAGHAVAICKLCQQQIAANKSNMHMHYRVKHCKPTSELTHADVPVTSKPLYVRDHEPVLEHVLSESLPHKAHAPDDNVRDACLRACDRYYQHVHNVLSNQDNGVMVEHSNTVDGADNIRKRQRTLRLLQYLASGASDKAYAMIIRTMDANDQLIRTIREIQRAYILGDIADLTPAESLMLSRYRTSIERSVDGISMEQYREVLLKPHRCMPKSVHYVPVLLALALDRDGLEPYIDKADDNSMEQSSKSDEDIEEDEPDSPEDSDEETETESGEDEDEEGTDKDTETESGEDEAEEGTDKDTETESGEDEAEEGTDEDIDTESGEDEESDDEDAEAESEEDEAEEEGESDGDTESSEEGEDERNTTKNRKRRHSEESEDEDSDDAESNETEEDEDAEPEEGDDEQHTTENLKPRVAVSQLELWKQRQRARCYC